MKVHGNGTFELELDYGTYSDCSFVVERGKDGEVKRICIKNDEEQVATVTLPYNLPRELLAIKSHSENAGMLREMKRLGLVTKVVGAESCGYTVAPVCRYSEAILHQFES